MFATVEFYEREDTFKERLRSFFSPPKIITEKVPLPENEYFYKIKVPLHKGEIPYDKLKRISSGVGDGLIFPKDFKCEESTGIKIYSSRYFKETVLFNTAVSLIKESVFEPTQTVITLVDKKGVLASEVNRIVPYAYEIRVVTDNIRAYEFAHRRIMNEYGLSVLVSDKLSSISKEGIVISYDSSFIPLYFKGLVLTAEKRFLPFARVLVGEGITADEKYRALCPENVDAEAFLSALCEVCFIRELRKTEYEKLVDISAGSI